MYETALPSDTPPPARIPSSLRSHGRILVEARALGARTVLGGLEEAGPSRARFPLSGKRGASLEAVLINTGGGIAGGDGIDTRLIARAGARLVATTQAAEKIYRSDGSVARLGVDLSVEEGASLDWLPQWTILFNGARAARTIRAQVASDARLLLVEPLLLGRAARGERMEGGLLTDSWRVRRGGRLVYADGLHLSGDIAATLERPALAGGAAALATVLLVAPDAEARLDEVRAALGLPDELPPNVEAGASAWDGLLAVRLLAPESAPLDRLLRRLVAALGVAEPPRIWQS